MWSLLLLLLLSCMFGVIFMQCFDVYRKQILCCTSFCTCDVVFLVNFNAFCSGIRFFD